MPVSKRTTRPALSGRASWRKNARNRAKATGGATARKKYTPSGRATYKVPGRSMN